MGIEDFGSSGIFEMLVKSTKKSHPDMSREAITDYYSRGIIDGNAFLEQAVGQNSDVVPININGPK
jgi:hypothetical protein